MRTLLFLCLPVVALAQSTIATWTLVEPAGINHPSQLTCFPYSGGTLRYESNRVIGPASTEVAWQQRRDGAVCVIASLSADDPGDVYTLQSGAATTVSPSNPVNISKASSYIEIRNGLSGVRIPNQSAQSSASPAYSLAPISQVLIGGAWTGDTPKLLPGSLNGSIAGYPGPVQFCTGFNQTIAEAGRLFVTVLMSLACDRPAYYYGGLLREAGTGFFNSEVTFHANQNSFLFSFYTDLDVRWELDISSAYSSAPNLLAWRGISTASLACGYYLPDGATKTIYPPANQRGEMTALRDLDYSAVSVPYLGGCGLGYNPTMIANYLAGPGSDNAFAQWLLNDSQGDSYPVVGMWTSSGAKQIGRIAASGFSTFPSAGVSIYHKINLRGDDGTWKPIVGAEYGYFTGTQADVPSKTDYGVRPAVILNAMNTMRGFASLERLYLNTLSYSDPVGGYKWPFLPEDIMADRISRINSDTDYFNALIASDVGTEGIRFVNWARYQDGSNRSALLNSSSEIKTAIERWVLGDGRFDSTYHYYQGLYPVVRSMDNFHAVIKDASASADQVNEAKRWLGLGVYLANSNDYFNFDECTDGCGNVNQVYQYNVFRNVLALVMSHHPSAASLRPVDSLGTLLTGYWNSSGSGKASTHYQSNYAEPAAALLLSAKKKGAIASLSAYPELRNSINWDISSLTPPEPRFNNKRKVYSNGDGNTEASMRLGVIGSVFNSDYPGISSNAIWAWRSQDTSSRYSHSSFYFPTVEMIDDQITQTDPAIGSLYMSGYHAALRTGWETANETVAWFIHGGWYSDHKHRDNGQVSIYAHQAPLAVDWNANLYSPQTAGGYMHSRAIREGELSDAWDGAMTNYGIPDSEWGTAASTEFGKFQYGSFSKSTFGATWTRDVRLLYHSATYPIIIIRDSFSGADAAVSKIVSSTHMANGAVTVNGSGVTPTVRDYDDAEKTPSCTAGVALSAGLNRLQFTGQTWAQHATGGIDWDTYLNIGTAASYCLGNWSHVSHPSREMSEYNTANGSSFRERQHILRVKTSDTAMETILLPWRKGESTTFAVTNQACGTRIVRGTNTVCSSANAVQWTDGTDYSLMSTGITSATYQNMTISGGPGEIRTSGSSYVAIVDGLTAANRTITLPAGTWYPNAAAVAVASNQFRLFHDGTTAQPRTVTFSSTPSGVTMPLGFSPPSGAVAVRILLDGVAVAEESCASTCTVSIKVPSATYTMQHKWIDLEGNVVLTSTARSITI